MWLIFIIVVAIVIAKSVTNPPKQSSFGRFVANAIGAIAIIFILAKFVI